ncbi:D-sedoheptulose 7-phosphate isomerase [Mucilaginibacter myungsuensis]|uniref:Phosphoheptose isomerase n=1 Tax=Mucilaginibacter myungsuensis TaxID=649104 RepID=A0A929L0S3_9SPHI|nr:D-sedoheptulose 7-phosphate isomerase [Mucilaginibacter myungsuensis]MBE9662399.1 D-sedoheptulose 7-phosphate isomerase [Mucilaginibacter myungsuensis]MDN3599164.1 D-sedoheptulose 7-phosphate isomerase [Mucilaginibacter myungsuensis]
MKDQTEQLFEQHIAVAKLTLDALKDKIDQASQQVIAAIKNGNKVLLFGNGGSASDAQHIAAELVGRFVKQRRSLPSIALTTDTSALTAIGNDYGFEHIFERQVEGLAVSGDVLIGISTSGNSPNVLKAIELGKAMGCKTIGLLGNDGGKIAGQCDIDITIPSKATARIQEMHILIGHIICTYLDDEY